MKQLLCINTGGIGDLHGRRMRRLTEGLEDIGVVYVDVDKRRSRRENLQRIHALLSESDWDLVYQEGTGIAGGLALIHAARTRGLRYVVSSGDPVGGFFRTTRGPLYGTLFSYYERLLYRHSAGFIGWTPYLVGLALHHGAPRAVTVEGAVDTEIFRPATPEQKARIREELGLPPEALVCGIVGSIRWVPRQQYGYGLELVSMLRYLKRRDVAVLIVGDGDGLQRLRDRVPPDWQDRVRFTGRVPETDVARMLQAMDIGFITQTLDGLGSFRLTTKLPEYLAAGLAVAMSPIPGYYDYLLPAGWGLPAAHPASPEFHRELATWLDTLSPEEVRQKAAHARDLALHRFAYPVVIPRFRRFIYDILEQEAGMVRDTCETTPAHIQPAA